MEERRSSAAVGGEGPGLGSGGRSAGPGPGGEGAALGSRPPENGPAAALVREVAVPALATVFGMQTFRVLLPLLVYVLRDRIGLEAMHLGGIALALFALAFFVGPSLRRIGPGRLAFGALAALVAGRTAVQLWHGDPLVDLGLTMVGTVSFLFYVPAAARRAGRAAPGFALGVLLGLGLDVALNGALGTYDLAWRTGPAASAAVAGSALAAVGLAWRLPSRSMTPAGGVGPAWPWVALGPLLALEMLLFQNVARLAALADLSLAAAAATAVAGHAAGLAAGAAVVYAARAGRAVIVGVAAAAVVLVLSVIAAAPHGAAAVALFVVGQAALGAVAVPVLALPGAAAARGATPGPSGPPAGAAPPRPGPGGRQGRWGAAHGGGMVVLVLFLFLAYAGYDIALPFPADFLPPAAALVAGACAVRAAAVGRGGRPGSVEAEGAAVRDRGSGARPPGGDGPAPLWPWAPALVVLALTAVPAVQSVVGEELTAAPGTGGAVRVMTFNLHNGFATDGRLDLEALAAVIEEQDPDVLALQEVSRGWVVNGTVDVFQWLSRRLGMPGVYGATSGPLWGNALLSRFPVESYELVPLPTEELLLRRGLIDALVAVGGAGGPLRVIATHYHHPDDGGPVRVLESARLLEGWAGAPRTVVMGDLNGEPGAEEIEMLRAAGFLDVLDLAGVEPGHTYSSDSPDKRIDYVWVTVDLLPAGGGAPSDVRITTGTASDHLGVAATIDVGE